MYVNFSLMLSNLEHCFKIKMISCTWGQNVTFPRIFKEDHLITQINILKISSKGNITMKIVVLKAPKVVAPILRSMFHIKKNKK